MCDDPAATVARATAQRLTPTHGAALVGDVEAALHAPEDTTVPDRYLDPVSLGALIVAIASLAWTVYTDLRKNTPTPSPDVITRTIRVQLGPPPAADHASRDQIINVTVEETLRLAQDTDGPVSP